jgi:ribosomal protein L22
MSTGPDNPTPEEVEAVEGEPTEAEPVEGEPTEAEPVVDPVSDGEADSPTGVQPAADAVPDGEDGPRAAADAAVAAPADEDALATSSSGAGEVAQAAEEKPAPSRSRSRRRAPNAQPEPKPAKRRESAPDVTVRAQAKYVRTSARKARIVCDHIRGKDVEQARAILAFTPRGAAEAWSKLLESAVANAEHNHELVGDELRVASVHADEGPTLKRFRPRAMGRATKIRKRTSHLTITLTPKD